MLDQTLVTTSANRFGSLQLTSWDEDKDRPIKIEDDIMLG